jgi:hypothetical protein
MKTQMSRVLALALFALAGMQFSLLVKATAEDKSAANTGQLRVIVSPEEAYIW